METRKNHTYSQLCIVSSIIIFSVGKPKYNVVIPSTENQLDSYMGKNLEGAKRGLYKIKHPISHGVINNWDDMEQLWKYAFSDLLKIAPN